MLAETSVLNNCSKAHFYTRDHQFSIAIMSSIRFMIPTFLPKFATGSTPFPHAANIPYSYKWFTVVHLSDWSLIAYLYVR